MRTMPAPKSMLKIDMNFMSARQVAEEPDQVVQACQVPVGGGVEVGCSDHGEGLDVHDQDPQDGESAKDVQGEDRSDWVVGP